MSTLSMRDAERWSTSAALNALPVFTRHAIFRWQPEQLGGRLLTHARSVRVPANLLKRDALPGRDLVKWDALIEARLLR